nr:hypothetical protein [Tanacetum cinerariifolium]
DTKISFVHYFIMVLPNCTNLILFYNALNPADQDSLNSATGGNLLERRTQDVLTIIENKSKQTSVVTTTMTVILKQVQATPPPASVKAVEEICVTCGVVPLSELEKIKKMNEINIKVMQTQINNVKNELRNEMKTLIQDPMSNQTNELKNIMASFFQMNIASTSGSGPLLSNTIANPQGELKAITTQSGLVLDGPFVHMPPPFINPEEDERVEKTLTNLELGEFTIKVPPPLGELKSITTQSGIVLDGPFIPIPPPFINPEEDERVEETLTDPKLGEFTIKVAPPLVQKPKPPSQRNFMVHQRDPLHPNICYPSWMHKQKQQEKDEVQIHKFWQMFRQRHINITLADALILILKY